MKRRSADAAALLRAAHGFHSNQQLAAAASLYRQVLEIDPNNFDALHLSGVCAYQLGRKADALALLNRALALRRDVTSVFSHRALLLNALGRHADAVRDLDEAIALAPASAELHFDKSNMLRGQKRLGEARLCLERALELDCGNASYLNNLAGVLVESGQQQEALECLDRLAGIDPSSPDVHFNRAIVLQKLGRTGEAIAGYDKAIALRPDDPFFRCKRGRALNSSDRSGQALADYEKVILLKPDHAEAHFGKGIALQNLNRLHEALQSYARAIAVAGENAELMRRRGDVQLKLGFLHEAHASFELALRLDPAHAAVHVGRGRAFADQEEWERAQEEYEQALRIEQGMQDALRGLAKLPVGTLAKERVVELLAIVETTNHAADPAPWLFTKAGLLEKLDRYEEAFACITEANRHRLEALTDTRGDPEFWQHCADQQGWSPATHQAAAGGRRKILVILGPSRSGKTSLERLLCQDGRFFRGGEGDGAAVALQRLTELQGRGELGQGLLQVLFPLASAVAGGGPEVFTLTNPYLLPGAHRIFDLHEGSFFVFVERDPRDVAAEIFRKDYRSRSPFTCRADWALSHAVRYLEATRTLQAKMKGRCLSVAYEDILSAPEEVRSAVHALLGIGVPADAQRVTRRHDRRDPASPYKGLFMKLL